MPIISLTLRSHKLLREKESETMAILIRKHEESLRIIVQ